MSELLRRRVGARRETPPWKEVKFKCAFHNTIYDVLKSRGFRETDSELEWDIFWCEKDWIHDMMDQTHLQAHQKVNHFRNHFELTRKDLMIKNIKRAQRQAQRDGLLEDAAKYGMCSPMTFVLPLEYAMFVEEFKKQQQYGTIWIMKPVGAAQGRGIFLFDQLAQVAKWKQKPSWMQRDEEQKNPRAAAANKGDEDEESQNKNPEPYVVQRYLSDPLLIGGKKFDLRLYVLVTSYTPLTVWMYRSGFARFSHVRFSMDSISDPMVHLTNVAVQKHNEHYDEKRGGKWDLHSMKQYLLGCKDPEKVEALFREIQDVIIFSLLAVQKIMIQDKHCFELYGYDIMISSDLKPWLIEVNASPSLTANTAADYSMKFALLDDTLTILDFEKYLTGGESQVGGFDLLYRNGQRVGPSDKAVYRSYLGCHNNRRDNLQRLSRALAKEEERRRTDGFKPAPSAGAALGQRRGAPCGTATRADDAELGAAGRGRAAAAAR